MPERAPPEHLCLTTLLALFHSFLFYCGSQPQTTGAKFVMPSLIQRRVDNLDADSIKQRRCPLNEASRLTARRHYMTLPSGSESSTSLMLASSISFRVVARGPSWHVLTKYSRVYIDRDASIFAASQGIT